MNTVILVLLLTCASVNSYYLSLRDPKSNCTDLAFTREAKYMGIPFVKREKDIFINDSNERKISKIFAYDGNWSKASAIVTAGGIGHTYVNIRLKSERSVGLDYSIYIYSCTDEEREKQ